MAAATNPPPAPRRIEYLALSDLVPADRNPKEHDDEGITGSIVRFGVVEPQVLDERTGKLVVGHGRWSNLLALAAEGGPPPEGVEVDGDGRWLVPIVRGWASKDDREAEAYLVASNNLTTRGGWDDVGLVAILAELRDVDPALLAVTGYSGQALDDMIAVLAPPPDPGDLADEYDPDLAAGDDDSTEPKWLRLEVGPAVLDAWRAHRDAHVSDDAALAALLGQ